MHLTTSERESGVHIASGAHLQAALTAAAEEAASVDKLVFLRAQNGNTMNVAVGGPETSLGFVHGHGKPPYYCSQGTAQGAEPVLTCFQSLEITLSFREAQWFQLR